MIVPRQPKEHCKPNKFILNRYGRLICLVIALVVAAGCLVVLFMQKDSDSIENLSGDRIGFISEVTPTKVLRASEEEPKQNNDVVAVERNELLATPQPKANSPWANKPARVIKMREADVKPRRFVYDSEEDIAALLEIVPGTQMFGDLPYNRFEKDFRLAIMQKVKIEDSDDEYTKELKRQVQAVKDDLKEIMVNGGDVAAEMRKARNELMELGRFRDSLMRELHELRKSGEYTSQDIRDFEAAANKMLENKGLKPIKVPTVLLRNMELKERMNH